MPNDPELAEKAKQYRKRNWEKIKLQKKLYMRANPEARLKHAARKKVYDEIKRGNLNRLPCQACNNPKSEAHHSDYTKPLQIIWLCRDCHIQRDAYENQERAKIQACVASNGSSKENI